MDQRKGPPSASATTHSGDGDELLELISRTELEEAVRQAVATERRRHEVAMRRIVTLIAAYRRAFDTLFGQERAVAIEHNAGRFKALLQLQGTIGREVDATADAHAVLELLATFDRLGRDDYAAIERGEIPMGIVEILKKLLPSDD